MHLYITSTTSRDIFPGNNVNKFNLKLPRNLNLTPHGAYSIALLDIDLPRFHADYTAKYITIYSSLCQPCVYKDAQRPVLARLYFSDMKTGKPFHALFPRYVPLNTDSIDCLDLFILDDRDLPPSFKPGQLTCTLDIRKKDGV